MWAPVRALVKGKEWGQLKEPTKVQEWALGMGREWGLWKARAKETRWVCWSAVRWAGPKAPSRASSRALVRAHEKELKWWADASRGKAKAPPSVLEKDPAKAWSWA